MNVRHTPAAPPRIDSHALSNNVTQPAAGYEQLRCGAWKGRPEPAFQALLGVRADRHGAHRKRWLGLHNRAHQFDLVVELLELHRG